MAVAPPRKKSAQQAQLKTAALYPLDWLEERSGLVGGVKYFLFRKVPRDTGWFHTLGSATLTAFLVQAITGVVLAMYYKPDPDSAYESIQFITNDLTLGWLVRGMHRWGASVFIILMFLHMARVFLFGSYKYPRELNWIIGVLLLALGMLEGFTGYLLPWDQTAYWATVVGINLNGTVPMIGPFLAQFLAGGAEIGSDTLSKFYSLHMLVIPGGIFALIGLHLYLVIRLGVTSPPWSAEAAGRDRPTERSPAGGREGLVRPGRRGGSSGWLAAGSTERRAQHKRYKEDVERTGKPFFPYAMFHDTVMSLVVVCVIVGLACVWYFTADGSDGPRLARPVLHRGGRPGDDQLRAAARLVLLLPLLPAADLQVAGHRRPRHRRRPEHPARDHDRAAVHRRAPRAPALPAPGRDRRGDRRRAGDGDADLQGRDGEGVPRLRDDQASAEVGGEAGLRG